MPGLRNKLTAATVRSTVRTGRHADGAGLYLQVTRHPVLGNIRKSWLVRYRADTGKIREIGIGSIEDVSLADAREKAAQVRLRVREGRDLIAERQTERKAALVKKAREMTFQQCAEAYVAAHEASWRNDKHKAQWSSTLKTYAYPVFGKVPVGEVTVAMIMKVLDPIWSTKTETASRLRGRLENILDWATVREYRTGENPARWRGHLEKALPAAKNKARKIRHHAALPIDDVPAFMTDLAAQPGVSALAFRFTILTATRTSEAIGARWDEIDFGERAWLIPEDRMKAGRPHRVPLSDAALTILQTMRGHDPVHVFPGLKSGKPISNMAFLMTLRRMGRTDLTAHGFRSTFRDWAAERTEFQGEVAEAALAHVVGNKVEAAYRRGDLFEKRRALMDAWAGIAGGV
jgi:integrase